MYHFGLVSVLLGFHGSYGANILLVCAPFYSHTAQYVAIGTELVKLGHEVSLATAETVAVDKLVKGSGISVIRFTPPNIELPQLFGAEIDEFLVNATFVRRESPISVMFSLSERGLHYCDAMLSDKQFMSTLEKTAFDLMLIDSLFFVRCFVLLPKKLNVLFVAETPVAETLIAGAPFLPSVTPSFQGAHVPGTGFFGRLQSLMFGSLTNLIDFPVYGSWLIEKHLPDMNGLKYRDMLSDALFFFCGTNDPIMDYPRPITPNMALIGGLTTKPAQPLPGNLEKFMSSAEHGVVVFSMGSIANKIPAVILQRFLDAFSRLDQNVLMKVQDSKTLNVSDNVRIEKWLPQNDLLGHNKTKLFITHGGANSVYEALYHGVPMIAVPVLQNDQLYNANKIVYKGFGLSLDILNFQTDEAYNTIQHILKDPSYARNIKKASKAFRDSAMTPSQTAAFWISYVIKNGGDFVRPLALDMPGWKSAMIDLFAFVTVCIFCVFWIFYTCLKCSCEKLSKRNIQILDHLKKEK